MQILFINKLNINERKKNWTVIIKFKNDNIEYFAICLKIYVYF